MATFRDLPLSPQIKGPGTLRMSPLLHQPARSLQGSPCQLNRAQPCSPCYHAVPEQKARSQSVSVQLSHVFSPSLKSCLQLSHPLHSSTHGHLSPPHVLAIRFLAPRDHLWQQLKLLSIPPF